MPNNYILLETIALTQSAASVTFDNLPTSGYTDLKIVISARNSAGGTSEGIFLQMNSVATGYSNRVVYGNFINQNIELLETFYIEFARCFYYSLSSQYSKRKNLWH